jgi:cephalosporin hydroxylase
MKSPYRSIKHSTYFQAYEELFSKYRGKPIVFVEIGVLGGGSLFMWRDYFGPQARIIGVDLNPGAMQLVEAGFEIFIGSQSSLEFWCDFIAKVGDIDVVLDDGGHTYEQQVITVEALSSHIKDGGMIVVEDTHTSYMSDFGPQNLSFIEYSKLLIDKINKRFSAFSAQQSEKRFWSIYFYESIVALNVNRIASRLQSVSTENRPEVVSVEDFRIKDQENYWSSGKPKNQVLEYILRRLFPNTVKKNLKKFVYDRRTAKKIGKYF